MNVQTTPASYVELGTGAGPEWAPRDVRIWYAPREEGGQSFMITTTSHVDDKLDLARSDVIATFGARTVEFTHADMEARGIRVADLGVDTLSGCSARTFAAPSCRSASLAGATTAPSPRSCST